jgi:molybdopterin/thiamine biosynthesis adenylyltransferase
LHDAPGGGANLSRNTLWLSPELREAIAQARVAVVGCGGNGALFVALAAHLGYQHLALCDPDILDATNLNRYLVARPEAIGKPKVEVVKQYLAELFPAAEVSCCVEAFPNAHAEAAIKRADIVVGCMDNVHFRIELDVLARKYSKRLVDLGTGFVVDPQDGAVQSAGGQVMVSRPGDACLQCLGFGGEIREHNYFLPDSGEPEPSSVLLNSLVATLAVECVTRELVGELAPVNLVSYDRGTLSIQTVSRPASEHCNVCGEGAGTHVRSVGSRRGLGPFVEPAK